MNPIKALEQFENMITCSTSWMVRAAIEYDEEYKGDNSLLSQKQIFAVLRSANLLVI